MGCILSAVLHHQEGDEKVHSCEASLSLLAKVGAAGDSAAQKDRSGHAQNLRGLLLDKTRDSGFRTLLPLRRKTPKSNHAGAADDDAQSDPDFLARAKAVALAVTPFLPARVSTAFAAGVSRSAVPRRSQAALLIIDVSGFTALSEDARKRYGSEGVEHFSLVMSKFFAVMMELIVSFQGDVDCFAGDAVLIVFEPRKDDADPVSMMSPSGVEQEDGGFVQPGMVVSELPRRCESEESQTRQLKATVRQALECAKAIHARLEGFRDDPQDNPLRMHSGLAAGELVFMECGGPISQRAEAFLLGTPLAEIANALDQAKETEIALAPSAACLLARDGLLNDVSWQVQPAASSGHVILAPTKCKDGINSAAMEESLDSAWQKSLMASKLGGQSNRWFSAGDYNNNDLAHPDDPKWNSRRSLIPLDDIVSRMAEIHMKVTSDDTPDILAVKSESSASSPAVNDSWDRILGSEISVRRTPTSSELDKNTKAAAASLQQEKREHLGMRALLRFLPSCVRENVLGGHCASTLMEHRTVTILFIIADMKVHEGKYCDADWLQRLQDTLGSSVDAVEAQFGGATRQIAADDKGLAMIFVFGLPGYLTSTQRTPCVLAARKVLGILSGAGIEATAGVTTGTCFCGVIGEPEIRCEYAVMGDEVNTGARLAVEAAKKGVAILCSEAVVTRYTQAQLQAHGLELQLSHSVRLKGKRGDSKVYVPAEQHGRRKRAITNFVGREQELQFLRRCVAGSFDAGPWTDVGIRLIALGGGPGIGKSAVVETLMNTTEESGDEQQQKRWFLLHGAGCDGSPFTACHDILCWLLEIRGEPEADRIAWLLDDYGAESDLPPLLRRHSSSLQDVRSAGGHVNNGKLHDLYANVIWDALQETPVVLVLENAELVDTRSLNVLRWLVSKLGGSESTTGSTANVAPIPKHTSVLLCTVHEMHSLGIQDPPTTANALHDNLLEQNVVPLQLEPLADARLLELAQLILGNPLSESIAAFLLDRCKGSPMEAVEISEWLIMEGLVADGQPTSMAAGVELEHLVPPTMKRRIQVVVDELPTLPLKLVRSVSVLGHHFNAEDLLSMVAAIFNGDKELFMENLAILRDWHLIQPVIEDHNLGARNSDVIAGKWKFCNPLYQDIVQNGMTFQHKRSAHKKAAEVFEAKLEKSSHALEMRPLLRKISMHRLQSVRSVRHGGVSKLKKMEVADLAALARAMGRGGQTSQDLGDYGEAYKYRDELLKILEAQNEMTGHEMDVLELEIEAVEGMSNLVMILRCLDKAFIEACVGNPEEKLYDLSTRQEQLQGKLNQIRKSRMRQSNQKGSYSASPGMSFVGRAAFAAKFIPVGIQTVNSQGFVTISKLQLVLDELHPERPPVERAYIGTAACIVRMWQASCWDRLSFGESCYRAFQEAGEPYTLNSIAGFPLCKHLLFLWGSGQLWAGRLTSEAEAAYSAAEAKVDPAHLSVVAILREFAEASWEPVVSRRVAAVQRVRTRGTELKKPMDSLGICMDKLCAFSKPSQTVAQLQASRHAAGTSGMADLLRIAQEALRASLKAAALSLHVGCQVSNSAVATSVIWEGCRILFPESSSVEASLSSVSLEHLSNLTAALSETVERWSSTGVNVFGEAHFLPSTLMWARSMQHLFQWVMLKSAARLEAPLPVHLQTGIAGLCSPKEGLFLRDGAAAACSGLFTSQRIGVERGELMPGCLPATVALARLLRGQECCSILEADCMRTSIVLPETMPEWPSDLSGSSNDKLISMPVRHVSLGSSAAREVARQHLEGVLKVVTVRGRPIVLSAVQGPADVADSETLWSAVKLWREL